MNTNDLPIDHFDDDVFDNRKDFAETLERLIESQSKDQPCIMHLYANWGDGKTWFLRRWMNELQGKNITSIYFDAFSHDLYNDPFISIVSEIISLIDPKSGHATALHNAAKKVFQQLSFNTLEVLSSGLIKADDIKKVNDEYIAELESKYFDIELARFQSRNTEFNNFRHELQAVCGRIREESGYPLIFIIDELDRCRPDYAIAILEKIKHLFEVPNLVFILAMNREQILNSIEYSYGSKINAHIYLKKFSTIEINLPKPPSDSIGDPHYGAFYRIFCEEKGIHHDAEIHKLLRHNNLSLREMERIFKNIDLLFSSISNNHRQNSMITQLVAFVSFLKEIHPEIFSKILNEEKPSFYVSDFFPEEKEHNDNSIHAHMAAIFSTTETTQEQYTKVNSTYKFSGLRTDPVTFSKHIAKTLSYFKSS